MSEIDSLTSDNLEENGFIAYLLVGESTAGSVLVFSCNAVLGGCGGGWGCY